MRARSIQVLALLMSTALGTTVARAADVTLEIRTPGGQPVRDTVATLYPAHGDAPAPSSRISGPFRLTQAQIQFHPFVLLVPVGATVSFPNLDRVRHHVYSFSPAKTFELKLYGQEDKRVLQFEKAGVVAVGCNIHDRMSAFIDVVDTPYAAKSDEHGRITIHDVPDGSATLRIWHPYLKVVGQTISRTVTVRSGAVETFIVDLKAAPPGMMGG